ncbi:hypothetical protein ACH4ZU_07435 [Streptomyces sp. NPDC020472]|uniref:hypothetical protein n=1 Tax=Streptomyces sp. NPDC020472 TaxID=3365075 RepID=UPI0037A7629F
MTAPLPRPAPDSATDEEPTAYGVPSSRLVSRAEAGLARFLEREHNQADQAGHAVSTAGSFLHEDSHPWLHKQVRDIASSGEGELTAIVQEKNGSRTVRVAHIRPASGIEWTTAADNLQLIP